VTNRIGRNDPHVAPILYRIVQGHSSTSMSMVRRRKSVSVGQPSLFRKRGFDSTVVYKYPNFGGEWPEIPREQARAGAKTDDRPIETGIYIPNDLEDMMGGGYAIYLRQPNYRNLLRDYLGMDYARQDMDLLQDIRTLDVLDGIPSLDPFLVKIRFDHMGMPVVPGAIDLKPEEEAAMKKLIEDRVVPILEKSFQAAGGLSANARQRALEAIWNPSLPDSRRFVEAFGVHESECTKIFFALQGITYYEHLFGVSAERIKSVANWFRTVAAEPTDLKRLTPMERQRYADLRGGVAGTFAHTIKTVQGTFAAYGAALNAFLSNDTPAPLRQFLLTAHRSFWALGHGIMAMLNAELIVAEHERAGLPSRSTAGIVIPLLRLQTTMATRAEAHMLGGLPAKKPS